MWLTLIRYWFEGSGYWRWQETAGQSVGLVLVPVRLSHSCLVL